MDYLYSMTEFVKIDKQESKTITMKIVAAAWSIYSLLFVI